MISLNKKITDITQVQHSDAKDLIGDIRNKEGY